MKIITEERHRLRLVWEGFVEPPLEYVRVSLTKRVSTRIVVERRVLPDNSEAYWEYIEPHDVLYIIAITVALMELQLKDRT